MSRSRPKLYISAPWRHRTPDDERLTKLACLRALELGWVPIYVPWMFAQLLDDEKPSERKLAIECDLAVLEDMNGFLVVTPEKRSEGMRAEEQEWDVHYRHRRKFIGIEALERPELPWGESAVYVKNVEGWKCVVCNRFWGDDERLAKWCCAKQNPCDRCGALKEKLYSICDGCRHKDSVARFEKAPAAPWNGLMIHAEFDSKEWFQDLDEVEDHASTRIREAAEEAGATEFREPTEDEITAELEEMGLWLSEPVHANYVLEPHEVLADYLPSEDDGEPDLSSLDAPADAFNAAVAALGPLSYQPSKTKLDVKNRWKRHELGGDLYKPKHRDFCDGDCDEGRECWRGTLISPEDAARRGVELLDEKDVQKLIEGTEP